MSHQSQAQAAQCIGEANQEYQDDITRIAKDGAKLHAAAAAGLVLCIAGTGGTGALLCTAAYAIEVLLINDVMDGQREDAQEERDDSLADCHAYV